jgi:multicomponent Na+:H+ antiporter subunit B
MSKIVRSVTILLFPFGLVFGMYVVIHGHLTPGGGFQGGAVLATAIAMVMVAHRWDEITGAFKKGALTVFEMIGLLSFALIGLMGLLNGGTFLFNWLANTGGLFGNAVPVGPNPGDLNTAGFLPLLNLAVGLEVTAGLTLIVMYMTSYLNEQLKDKDDHVG